MRKLFTLCLLVFSLSASAQWQQTGSKVRYVNGLGIPTRDTAAGVAADSSQILIRPADSSLYVKYKRTWLRVGGGTVSGTTNYIPKFTSSSAIGNSQIFDNGTNVGIGTVDFGASGLSFSSVFNLSFSEGSGASYANIFRQRNTVATVIAHSLKRSGTANFASSFTGNIAKAAVAVGFDNGSISFFSDPASNVANGTDFTASERVRITSAGNTLLGTITDNGIDRLQVNGTTKIEPTATYGGGIYPVLASFLAPNTAATGGTILQLGKNSTLNATITWDNNTNKLFFQTNANGYPFEFQGSQNIFNPVSNTIFNIANTEVMRINNAFRVLINATDNGIDKLQVNGSIDAKGFAQAYTTKTGAYTATTSDYLIDCTSGTFTVTLPDALLNVGRILVIKNSGTGTITVDGNGSQTIDGATTYSLSAQYATVQLMCDGGNWKIIAKF